MNYFKADTERYRWVIVVAGICGLFASLGIGRFALGMLLPAMGEALGLSYAQMGFISTLNFCGYLFAVLLCGVISVAFGARLLITLALLLVGVSMLLIGSVEHPHVIMVLYCATGIGSALSNVPIMALVSAWFPPSFRGRAAGMVVVGNGFGLVASGFIVPVLNRNHGWQTAWLVLGSMAICSAIICWLLVKNDPADLSRTGQRNKNKVAVTGQLKRRSGWFGNFKRVYLHSAIIYFLFGITYVIYMTFFVTSLVQERGFSEAAAGMLWSWVGILSLGSGPLFGYLSDRFGRKAGLMTVFSIQAVAYGCASSFFPTFFIYISVACYGLVAWSIPSIMAALVGDIAGPKKAAAIFGFVTFIFGIGQIMGPYAAGVLAQATGGFAMSFVGAAILALTAVVISALLPATGRQE